MTLHSDLITAAEKLERVVDALDAAISGNDDARLPRMTLALHISGDLYTFARFHGKDWLNKAGKNGACDMLARAKALIAELEKVPSCAR